MQAEKDPKKAAGLCLDAVKLDSELYRLGHTKVFYRRTEKILSRILPL